MVGYATDDSVAKYRKQLESMTYSTFICSMVVKKTAAKRYVTANLP